MGFDIYAYGTDEELEEVTDKYGDKVLDFDDQEEVAYHRAYMGGFRMMREQGYDWFDLINAEECDGGVSGNGIAKKIKLFHLRNALGVLLEHVPNNLADNFGEQRDEFNDSKPELKDFMERCIKWCVKNGKESILIYFG